MTRTEKIDIELRSVVRSVVDRAVATELITRRAGNVLYMRWGLDQEPMTLDDIGEVFNLTREGVRQIEIRAKAVLFGTKATREVEKAMRRRVEQLESQVDDLTVKLAAAKYEAERVQSDLEGFLFTIRSR